MTLIEDHAICVRTWDWSETSQTAVLLSRDHGMIRVLAKGSKRDRSAFSGGLELCTLGQMTAIVKPNSDLALLTQWDLLGPMLGIRRSLIAYNAGMLAVDLIPRLIQDHDPHAAVHDSLLQLLIFCDEHGVQEGEDLDAKLMGMLAWYLWTVLVAIGAMPIVDHDVLTGDPLTPADVYGFSAQLGGITQDPITIQASHQAGQQDSSSMMLEGVWRIRGQTVEMMNSLGQSPPAERFMEQSKEQSLRLARLLGAYIRERTGSEIPAMHWLLNGI
ncbi:MAG: recombination protein O N-terminal domain-containing protein [Phycisphaerales bacterium]|nr:recombination protein O N-terminal domain-containing protein [Phycisphaerales bacterium]